MENLMEAVQGWISEEGKYTFSLNMPDGIFKGVEIDGMNVKIVGYTEKDYSHYVLCLLVNGVHTTIELINNGLSHGIEIDVCEKDSRMSHYQEIVRIMNQ